MALALLFVAVEIDSADWPILGGKLDQLLERRDTIYDNLRDLRFEYRSGKYSEGDFEAMKATLEQEAALLLAEIDQVTESQRSRQRAGRASSADRSAQ